MRRTAIVIVVALQALVLAYMAGEREYIVRFGEVVFLRTAPIDPRDVFRGDFVRLDYELSRVNASLLRGTLGEASHRKGQKVYAVLESGASDLSHLDYLTDVQPQSGVFMRGRIRYGGIADTVYAKYGIEQMFVEQGSGIDIEKRRGNRQTLQIPMEVEVALSNSGTAVLKGYRWSKLGIQLEVIRLPARDADEEADDGPLSPKLQVTLKNVSDENLALVNPGRDCAFTLVEVDESASGLEMDYLGCDDVEVSVDDRIELEPRGEYVIDVDLSESRWHVRRNGEVDELGRLAQWERFRIIYRAPDAPALARSAVWQGYMASRAFTAQGRID